jgi:hypothetical protein
MMKSVSWNEHFRLAQDQSKRGGRKWAVILITFRCASARTRLNCGVLSEGDCAGQIHDDANHEEL